MNEVNATQLIIKSNAFTNRSDALICKNKMCRKSKEIAERERERKIKKIREENERSTIEWYLALIINWFIRSKHSIRRSLTEPNRTKVKFVSRVNVELRIHANVRVLKTTLGLSTKC